MIKKDLGDKTRSVGCTRCLERDNDPGCYVCNPKNTCLGVSLVEYNVRLLSKNASDCTVTARQLVADIDGTIKSC